MTDQPGLRPRLAVMMILQYFGLGAWGVPLTIYLQAAPAEGGMAFSPGETAAIYSTFAFGGLLAPFFVGLLADRYFAAERLLRGLHMGMAVLLAVAAFWCQLNDGAAARPATAFLPLFLIMMLYAFACHISLTLTNTITMRNLVDNEKFGLIRLCGTFGYILAAVAAGWFFRKTSAQCLYLAAAGSMLMVLYARRLPHTPPKGQSRTIAEVMGKPALTMFRSRSFVAFALAAFLGNAMNQFYNVFTPTYLKELQVQLELGPLGTFGPEVIMTLGQWIEIVCMAATPWLIPRVGLKPLMALGLAGWALRPFLFQTGSLGWIVCLALPLHGFSYALFGMVANIFLDREAPRDLRAGTQGLQTFFSSGPAVLLGNILASRTVDAHRIGTITDWPAVWMVPFLGCTAGLLVFLTLFREPAAAPPRLEDGKS
ncbi:MAG: MFS transporter [Gemmataceae bacterium]